MSPRFIAGIASGGALVFYLSVSFVCGHVFARGAVAEGKQS